MRSPIMDGVPYPGKPGPHDPPPAPASLPSPPKRFRGRMDDLSPHWSRLPAGDAQVPVVSLPAGEPERPGPAGDPGLPEGPEPSSAGRVHVHLQPEALLRAAGLGPAGLSPG